MPSSHTHSSRNCPYVPYNLSCPVLSYPILSCILFCSSSSSLHDLDWFLLLLVVFCFTSFFCAPQLLSQRLAVRYRLFYLIRPVFIIPWSSLHYSWLLLVFPSLPPSLPYFLPSLLPSFLPSFTPSFLSFLLTAIPHSFRLLYFSSSTPHFLTSPSFHPELSHSS